MISFFLMADRIFHCTTVEFFGEGTLAMLLDEYSRIRPRSTWENTRCWGLTLAGYVQGKHSTLYIVSVHPSLFLCTVHIIWILVLVQLCFLGATAVDFQGFTPGYAQNLIGPGIRDHMRCQDIEPQSVQGQRVPLLLSLALELNLWPSWLQKILLDILSTKYL